MKTALKIETKKRRPEWGLFLGAIAIVAATLLLQSHEYLLLAGMGMALALFLLPISPWTCIGFYGAVLALRVPMNEMPVRVGGIRFYAGDLVLYFFGALLLYAMWQIQQNERPELLRGGRREYLLFSIMGLFVFWGVFSFANGVFLSHLPFRDAFGDFRRLYVYMFGMLIPLGLPLKEKHLSYLRYAILAGGVGASLFGLYRIGTGNTYHAFKEHFEYIRYLSDDEIVSLAIVLAYTVSLVVSPGSFWMRIAALGFAGVAVSLMFISGWRMGIMQAILTPMLTILLLAYARRTPIYGSIIRLCVVAVILLMGGALVMTLFSGVFERMLLLMQERIDRFGIPFVNDMRAYAYRAAFREYISHPIIGTGLGHQLSYVTRGSMGQFVSISGTTHNIFLDILYQTGPLGFAFFVSFHGVFFVKLLRGLREIPLRFQQLAVAMVTGYCVTMLHYCYEPTYISGMVAVYMMMGFLLRFMRITDTPQPAEHAS